MSTPYKSLSKSKRRKAVQDEDDGNETAAHQTEHEQRVLLLSSRGVTLRQRNLLDDLHALMPHSRKESKLDTKTKLYQLNELADLYNCNNVLFFESRKGQDLYVWMSKAPNGPTIKTYLQNLHTMSELHFPGNCLKGSRPILSFDKAFEQKPHLLLIREMLLHIFSVPPTSRKAKPFVDHVMGFHLADNKIWIRCYEILETESSKAEAAAARRQSKKQERRQSSSKKKKKKKTNGDGSEGEGEVEEEEEEEEEADGEEEDGTPRSESRKKDLEAAARAVAAGETISEISRPARGGSRKLSLVEIGPRFVLTPIVVLQGSFGGPVIYENPDFVSPNAVRAAQRLKRAGRFAKRSEAGLDGRIKRENLGLRTGAPKRKREGDELDDGVVFA